MTHKKILGSIARSLSKLKRKNPKVYSSSEKKLKEIQKQLAREAGKSFRKKARRLGYASRKDDDDIFGF